MQSYDEILRNFLAQRPTGEGDPDPGAWRTPGEYRKGPEREPDSNYLGPYTDMVGKRPSSYTPGEAWQAIKDFSGYTDIKEGINQLGEGNYLEGATQTGVGVSSAIPFSPLKGAPLVAGAGIFLGRRARTINLQALENAEALAERDLLRNQRSNRIFGSAELAAQDEAIRQKTGWSLGFPDREARTEIPDVGSQPKDADVANYLKQLQALGYRPTSTLQQLMYGTPELPKYPTLDTLLPHPRLYSAYPGARNIQVKPEGGAGEMGSYSALLDRITVNPDLLPDPRVTVNGKIPAMTAKQQDDLWSILLHEVTHAIQTREGFARGGVPSEFHPANYDDLSRGYNDNYRIVVNLGVNLGYRERQINQIIRHIEEGTHNPSDYPRLQAELEKILEKHTELKDIHNAAFQQYERLAGEAEARLVQHRRSFTREERKLYPPTIASMLNNELPIVKPSWQFHGATLNRPLIETRDTLLGDLIRPTRTMPPPRKDFLSYR